MDFETAMESNVSINAAIAELARHGHKAIDFDDCELFDCVSAKQSPLSTADALQAMPFWHGLATELQHKGQESLPL